MLYGMMSYAASDEDIINLITDNPDIHPLNLAFDQIKNINVTPVITQLNKLSSANNECHLKGKEFTIGLKNKDEIIKFREGVYWIGREDKFKFIVFDLKAYNRWYVEQLPDNYQFLDNDEYPKEYLESAKKANKRIKADIKKKYKNEFEFVLAVLNSLSGSVRYPEKEEDIDVYAYNSMKQLIYMTSKVAATKGADEIKVYKSNSINSILYVFLDKNSSELNVYNKSNSFILFLAEIPKESKIGTLLSLFNANTEGLDSCTYELHPKYKEMLHNKALKQGAPHGTAEKRAAP